MQGCNGLVDGPEPSFQGCNGLVDGPEPSFQGCNGLVDGPKTPFQGCNEKKEQYKPKKDYYYGKYNSTEYFVASRNDQRAP